MEELRQEFLAEAVSKLEDLRAELPGAGEISEERAREIFRLFHTLKGTAQTFELDDAGRLAHELENLLQAKRDGALTAGADYAALLKEGVGRLLETFARAREDRENIFPRDFIGKLRAAVSGPPSAAAAGISAEILGSAVPPEFLRQLSGQEKETLAAAIGDGKKLHIIEAGFDFADFADQYKRLRERLGQEGETVANFPSPKFALENKIGFQIFFVSRRGGGEIAEAVRPFGARLLSRTGAAGGFSNDLEGLLAQAVLAGETTARRLGKRVEFETSLAAGAAEVSNRRLRLLSATLLHLVRNAVDHAIEADGKVRIEISETDAAAAGRLILRVADDGRGIDLEKVRAKAVAKNLIPAPGREPSREELLDLIFAHGFSTSETVSEISGRGVGLDAVRDAVRQAGGTIGVESAPGEGTTFEIRLPKEI